VTLSVQAIVDSVRPLLQDAAGDRWTDSTIFNWIHEAQLTILGTAPGLYASRTIAPITATPRQDLPNDTHVMLGILGVCDVNGVVTGGLTPIAEDVLFLEDPAWMSGTPAMPLHYARLRTDDQHYYLYPVPPATGFVLMDRVEIPAAPDALGDTLPLFRIEAEPLFVDYVLYRCFGEDADNQNNMTLSKNYQMDFRGKLKEYLGMLGALV